MQKGLAPYINRSLNCQIAIYTEESLFTHILTKSRIFEVQIPLHIIFLMSPTRLNTSPVEENANKVSSTVYLDSHWTSTKTSDILWHVEL